ncbi:ABC transporter permease subunit [Phaeovulum sp.]|uniref:ABC transporter permease subunit n=1 Tax=Phaeovulum sp. TaxID=2934796 RepID=UPI0039E30B40
MRNPLRNLKTRNAVLQTLFVGGLAALVISGTLIAMRNLEAQGISSGFGFLSKATGLNVSFSLLPVTATDPYWWLLLIGFVNTIFLGFFGLLAATIVGMVVGLARTSANEVASLLGTIYVESFRNVPIILQVIFWYAVLTHLPGPRDALEFGGMALSSRGVFLPMLNVGNGWLVLAVLALVAAVILPLFISVSRKIAKPREERRALKITATAVCLAVFAAALLLGRPAGGSFVSVPMLKGLNFQGGLRIPPEFSALLIGIAVYGGSYIAEIVRGGFKSVSRGQIEAAQSLGLTRWQIFTRVRLPLALRAMLPILANQYVWLIKATTLGITVGFTDFFMIVSLTINRSGQTLEAIFILMAGFLIINFTVAAVFNRINKAIALKGNQLRT